MFEFAAGYESPVRASKSEFEPRVPTCAVKVRCLESEFPDMNMIHGRVQIWELGHECDLLASAFEPEREGKLEA